MTSEPCARSRVLELPLFLAFVLIVGWCIAELFLPRTVGLTAPPPTLRPEDSRPPDQAQMTRHIRSTPPAASRAEWRPSQLVPDWRRVQVLHSGTTTGNRASLKQTGHFSSDLSIHFVIGCGRGSGDGEVEVCQSWSRQTLNQNSGVIRICLIGDFSRHAPTVDQISALKGLLNYLMALTPIQPSQIKSTSLQGMPVPRYLHLTLLVKHRFLPRQ